MQEKADVFLVFGVAMHEWLLHLTKPGNTQSTSLTAHLVLDTKLNHVGACPDPRCANVNIKQQSVKDSADKIKEREDAAEKSRKEEEDLQKVQDKRSLTKADLHLQ